MSENPYASLGILIGTIMGQDAVRRDYQKANNILNSNKNTLDGSLYAPEIAGIDTTKSPLEVLGKNSNLWGEQQKAIESINQQLSNVDEPTQQIFKVQIDNATQVQKKLAADSDKIRSFLGAKGLELTGYGKGDDASATWERQKMLSDPNKVGFCANNGGQIQPTLPAPQFTPEQLQKYNITSTDLMKNTDIAEKANKKALDYNRDNFNYVDNRNKMINDLMTQGISPQTIAAMQGRIDEQARNIGMQYVMSQEGVDNGDYTNAATYVIKHGLPVDALPLFQSIANKYVTANLDTGGVITPTAVSGNSLGGIPKAGAIGKSYEKTLSPEGKQRGQEFKQTFNFSVEKFNKEFELQKQQFGEKQALQWASLKLQGDKLSLEQKEHVAGKVRAGIDVIKTENDNLLKQLVEINKNANPATGVLPPGLQAEADTIKARISENNANLSNYGSVIGNSLGMKNATPNKGTSDTVGQWIDKARAAGKTPSEIQEILRNKGYGNKYDSWIW